jgi:hypothetical protein
MNVSYGILNVAAIDLLSGVFSGDGLYVLGSQGLFVQPENRELALPSASITPFSASPRKSAAR